MTCKHPCDNCPFRKDRPANRGWLGAERMAQIIETTVEGDKAFFCHKTTSGDSDIEDRKVCAGALILESKINPQGNYSTRLLMGIKELQSDYSDLRGKEKIFDTVAEAIEFHKIGS